MLGFTWWGGRRLAEAAGYLLLVSPGCSNRLLGDDGSGVPAIDLFEGLVPASCG